LKLTKEQQKKLITKFNQVITHFEGHPKFPYILLEIIELHSNKSHDYATNGSPFSNIELCRRGNFSAWKGVIVRLGDKYSRLLNALAGKLFRYEGIRDAFLDNACYSIIGLIEYMEETSVKEEK